MDSVGWNNSNPKFVLLIFRDRSDFKTLEKLLTPQSVNGILRCMSRSWTKQRCAGQATPRASTASESELVNEHNSQNERLRPPRKQKLLR